MSGRRRPTVWMIGITLILTAFALTVAIRTVEAAPPKLAVSVSYDKRECAGAKAKVTPVTAGVVELDRTGPAGPVRVTLEEDAASPERIAVPGKGAITATLVLETARVKVIEGGSGPGARRIPLGKVKKLPKNLRLAFVGLKSADGGLGYSADDDCSLYGGDAERRMSLAHRRRWPAPHSWPSLTWKTLPTGEAITSSGPGTSAVLSPSLRDLRLRTVPRQRQSRSSSRREKR